MYTAVFDYADGYLYGAMPPFVTQDLNKGSYSHEYMKSYGELLKAFPYSIGYEGLDRYSPYQSTPIGLNMQIDYDSDVSEVHVYLAFGYGTIYGMTSDYPEQEVYIGNRFDFESVKSRLIGTVVNVTYSKIDGSSTTTNVVIDADMFPDNYTPNPGGWSPMGAGTHIETYYRNWWDPWQLPVRWWTINSVTLPS